MTAKGRADETPDPGVPGGGKGRRDEPGRTGIWPMSGPLPPSDAPLIAEGELGQGTRGAAGYADSGESELIVYRTDPVCGIEVNPEHAAATVEWHGSRYFFHSEDCRRRFDEAPARYAAPPAEPERGAA